MHEIIFLKYILRDKMSKKQKNIHLADTNYIYLLILKYVEAIVYPV